MKALANPSELEKPFNELLESKKRKTPTEAASVDSRHLDHRLLKKKRQGEDDSIKE
jgi:hypothetical protein